MLFTFVVAVVAILVDLNPFILCECPVCMHLKTYSLFLGLNVHPEGC